MSIAPYTDPATGKKMVPATVLGCNAEKRALRCCQHDTEHQTSCCRAKTECAAACSVEVGTKTCCQSPTDSCCSQAACVGNKIGDMKMGQLKVNECSPQRASAVCCKVATDACCNKMLVCQ